MDEKNTDITFGDIVFSSGKYVKDGKERNRYHKVGVLRVSKETAKLLSGHHLTIKLDTVPVGGDGWLRVFERDDSSSTVLASNNTVKKIDENIAF